MNTGVMLACHKKWMSTGIMLACHQKRMSTGIMMACHKKMDEYRSFASLSFKMYAVLPQNNLVRKNECSPVSYHLVRKNECSPVP